ncbi:MAG: hypothetical protein P8X81_03165 [Woeseiaceae bacterium]|jgi:DNA-binding MarR family transcriptional regulator
MESRSQERFSFNRKNMSMAATKPMRTMRMLDRALHFARKKLTTDITAQRLQILLAVYFNEGLSQRELLRFLDMTSITALSRNIADLSRLTTKKLKGPGLLELRVDPLNLRVKRVFLTKKGERFMEQWLAYANTATVNDE